MKAITLILLIVGTSISAIGQTDENIIIGKKTSLHSDILNEDRNLWISKPEGYDMGSDLYPVMYLLDGDGHFHHTTGLIDFMKDNDLIPDMIVVGIGNTDRTRDMTPPLDEPDSMVAQMSATAGGADNFLAFIRDELIPYMNSNYRTAPYKILVGHSFGGLFAVHTLIKDPELFNAYIAISPSLWYGDQSLLAPAENLLKNSKELNVSVFMTMGNEGGMMLGGAMKLAALFEEHKPKGFDAKFVPMPNETHGTVPHRSTYQGLEFIYKDYQPPMPSTYEEFLAVTGEDNGPAQLVEKISKHYGKLSDKYGYHVSEEAAINQLGYVFLQEQMTDAALMAFEHNTSAYPESANAFDSLGDGYKAAGRIDDAKKSYQKAVELAKKSGHPVGEVSAGKLKDLG